MPAIPFLRHCLQEFVTHSAINFYINKPWFINDGSPVICDRLSNSACALFIVKTQKTQEKERKWKYMNSWSATHASFDGILLINQVHVVIYLFCLFVHVCCLIIHSSELLSCSA